MISANAVIVNEIISDITIRIQEELNSNQFGFRQKSDCGLTKAMIFYKAKKYNYEKALLIDIQKAYNSVNLDILTDIIEKTFNNTGKKKILTISLESIRD